MATQIGFKIFRGDRCLRELELSKPEIRVGRSPQADIKLEDKRASRSHAIIRLTDSDVIVEDQQSTAGTRLNGEKISRAVLTTGDELVMGDTKVLVTFIKVLDVAGAAEEDEPTKAAAELPTGDGPRKRASKKQKKQRPAPAAAKAPKQPRAQAPQAAAPAMPDSFDSIIERPPPAQEKAPPEGKRALQVKVFWGDTLIDVKHVVAGRGSQKLTIGDAKGTDYVYSSEGLPVTAFPVVESQGNDWYLNFVPGMVGDLYTKAGKIPLSDLASAKGATRHESLDGTVSFRLPREAVVTLDLEGLNLRIRFVSPPRRLKTALFAGFSYAYLNVFLLSCFFHASLIASFMLFPYDTRDFNEDLLNQENRFAKLILEPPKEEKSKLLDKLRKDIKKTKKKQKQKGDEGKKGKKEAKDEDKREARKAIDPKDKEIARKSGILKLLDSGQDAGLDKLLNSSSLGGDLMNALGGIGGVAVGDSGGLDGLGWRGGNLGGGGRARALTLAELKTVGRGGGNSRYGDDASGVKKKERKIKVAQGKPLVMGGLDEAIIKKVIQRHRNQIRYCYERELVRHPNLFGKISVKFIIGSNGRVTSAEPAENTMKNRDVENCVIRRVKGWVFPKPKGGGIVIVTYPFVFKTSG